MARRQPDETLLLALACGATVPNAARQSGLSERTIYRRLADPEFRQKMRESRAEMSQRALGMLTAASLEAVKTLLSLQKDNVQASVRLGAARAVLELGSKMRGDVDFEERLCALEERQVGKGKR